MSTSKRFAFLFFLVVFALPFSANAQLLKFGPPVWYYADVRVQGTSNDDCQTAVTNALNAVAAKIAPLTITQTSNLTCPSNVASFSVDYRDSGETPTVPNRTIGFTAYCEGQSVLGPPFFDSTNGIYYCRQAAFFPESRNNGAYCLSCFLRSWVGNPIDPGFGNKVEIQTDYVGSGPFPLKFERIFNSAHLAYFSGARLGALWWHSYARHITSQGADGSTLQFVSAYRPDGQVLYFNRATTNGPFAGDPNVLDRLARTATGWQLTNGNDEVELYDAQGNFVSITNRAGLAQTLTYFTSGPSIGLLQQITDPFGRTLTFEYNSNSLISAVVDPAGGRYEYGYNTNDQMGVLTSVKYPDNVTRTYLHEDSNSGRLLTGIVGEDGVRFSSYGYESINSGPKRPVSTTDGDSVTANANAVSIAYVNDGSNNPPADVTTYLSATTFSTRHYSFTVNQGVVQNTSVTGPVCPSCGPASRNYDANGNVIASTDWNGNRTNYAYDLTRNLETQRVEGLTSGGGTTAQTRTIDTQWHATFRLPTLMSEPLRITSYSYDGSGNLLTKSVQATTDANGSAGFGGTATGAPRVWTYTYNANGQVLTIDGPRTDVADVTTYTYYANNDADINKRGNVATVTNAAGQVTSITSYNAHGQPLTIVDPNGLTTTLAYDSRERLTSRNVGGETTTYGYNNPGLLTKVTLPDGSFLSYSYDTAHRLTGIQDNLGNRVAYTLDFQSNRTQEQVFDPSNTLAQTRSRLYSSINRLFQELGAAGQTTQYGYDNQGNVTSVQDPLSHVTSNQYDPLNRLKQVTDPRTGVTLYGYNGLDALTSVTDPRNLATAYTVNGLGNLTQQVSPDTGTTSNTYDVAGNLLTQTDAKNQTTTYAYDALNRVTSITFQDGSKQTYAYDQGTNGLGRLSSITETDTSNAVTAQIAYGYDQKGRVTSETRTVNGVAYVLGYSYDSFGRLSGMSYPSGRTITYSFDGLGRISQVSTTKDSQTQVVVQNVQYHPFGGAKTWTLGNGQVYARTIDQDGRIASYTLGGTTYSVGFDAASRITSIGANTYGYDTLDRLTSAVLPSSNFAYSYDGVGNRLTKTTGANNDTYTYGATSNQIATLTPFGSPQRTFVFDADGSTTNDGVNTYAYDARGRMTQSTNTASTVTTYQVNALGQRVRKTNGSADIVFTYDTWGKLIAETDPNGALKREYIYLGDVPVGVVQ